MSDEYDNDENDDNFARLYNGNTSHPTSLPVVSKQRLDNISDTETVLSDNDTTDVPSLNTGDDETMDNPLFSNMLENSDDSQEMTQDAASLLFQDENANQIEYEDETEEGEIKDPKDTDWTEEFNTAVEAPLSPKGKEKIVYEEEKETSVSATDTIWNTVFDKKTVSILSRYIDRCLDSNTEYKDIIDLDVIKNNMRTLVCYVIFADKGIERTDDCGDFIPIDAKIFGSELIDDDLRDSIIKEFSTVQTEWIVNSFCGVREDGKNKYKMIHKPFLWFMKGFYNVRYFMDVPLDETSMGDMTMKCGLTNKPISGKFNAAIFIKDKNLSTTEYFKDDEDRFESKILPFNCSNQGASDADIGLHRILACQQFFFFDVALLMNRDKFCDLLQTPTENELYISPSESLYRQALHNSQDYWIGILKTYINSHVIIGNVKRKT